MIVVTKRSDLLISHTGYYHISALVTYLLDIAIINSLGNFSEISEYDKSLTEE